MKFSPPAGRAVRTRFESFIPEGQADYISNKQNFLESVGFEDGYAKFILTTEGEQNFRDLIDVSIGARKSVDIQSFKGFHTRFGITSKSPMIDMAGRLEMPNLKPRTEGLLHVREDRLSPGLTFDCRLFVSPLISLRRREFAKVRIEGEFFELTMNPFTGEAEYKFDASAGVTLPIVRFRNALRLLLLITASARKLNFTFEFPGFQNWEVEVQATNSEFRLSRELETLDNAIEILNKFGVSAPIEVSLAEATRNADAIKQFHDVLSGEGLAFKAEFSVTGTGFDEQKNVACISLTSVGIGRYALGIIMVIEGRATRIPNNKYQLLAFGAKIERRVISGSNGVILKRDLDAAAREITKKYETSFQVVSLMGRDEDEEN